MEMVRNLCTPSAASFLGYHDVECHDILTTSMGYGITTNKMYTIANSHGSVIIQEHSKSKQLTVFGPNKNCPQ